MKIMKGNPLIMGVARTKEGCNFSIQSQEESVELLLFQQKEAKAQHKIKLNATFKTGDIFSVCLQELCEDFYQKFEYAYRINGVYVPDPYAKTITDCGKFGNVKNKAVYRSRVELTTFDWKNDTPLNLPYDESIIYKLHVRGFTKSRTSGSDQKIRGTFAGITDKIPYLKELGITTLELMPCYEFEEVGRFSGKKRSIYTPGTLQKLNYWGYTGGLYFAPKASFCACNRDDHSNTDYTVEMKTMIRELHQNGIEVVMEMFFEDTVSANLIDDCIRYWVMEYHIDGIHYYGNESALDMLSKDPLLAQTKIYTVYWGNERTSSYKKMGNYNDHFATISKCFLKGDENQLTAFAGVLRDNPVQSAMINYVTNHNGFTMHDLVSYDRKHNEANGEDNRDGENFNHSWNCGVEGNTRKKKINELRIRQIKNAFSMLLLAQGTPLILAGDECLNSQEGNNNPYCIDSELTWLNWKTTKDAIEIRNYVKKLIAFRKTHKILHMPKKLLMSDTVSCGFPDLSYHGENAWISSFENYNRHMGVLYCSRYADEHEDELIYIAYNMHWETHKLALPTMPESCKWKVELTTVHSEKEIQIPQNRSVTVPPRAVVVLSGKCREDANGRLLQ